MHGSRLLVHTEVQAFSKAAVTFATCMPQVEGSIPNELSGTYFRNGPGMQVRYLFFWQQEQKLPFLWSVLAMAAEDCMSFGCRVSFMLMPVLFLWHMCGMFSHGTINPQAFCCSSKCHPAG